MRRYSVLLFARLLVCLACLIVAGCGAEGGRIIPDADELPPGTTIKPETSPPNSGDPNSGDPKTGDPKTGDPETGDPKTGDPKTGDPKTGDPNTADPNTGDPKTADPKTVDPNTGDPKAGDPKTGDPNTGDPKTADPKTGAAGAQGEKELDPRLSSRFFNRNKNAGVEEISFEDINLRIQADVAFRPFMLTDRVKELDGKRVRIKGYMMPFDRAKGLTEFVLLRNTECKFGPGGQADHLLRVFLKEGVKANYQTKPISIEGVIKVKPYKGLDGNTWSIYDLVECDKIKTYRQ